MGEWMWTGFIWLGQGTVVDLYDHDSEYWLSIKCDLLKECSPSRHLHVYTHTGYI